MILKIGVGASIGLFGDRVGPIIPALPYPVLTGGIVPDISADFVAGHYYLGTTKYTTFALWLAALGGGFSRSSAASFVDNGVVKIVSSNVPRIGAKGFRITGGGTNLQFQSQFATGWQADVGDTFTPNAVVAPDGTTTAVNHIPVAATHQHSILFTAGTDGFVASTVYTFSVFAKSNVYPNLQLDLDNSGGVLALFTLTGAGSISNIAAGTTAVITALANGWYLCSITGPAVFGGNINAVIYTTGNGTTRTWTGDGVSSYSFWGAQITLSPVLLDYMATTTAAATQAMDYIQWPYSQTTFSALVGTNHHDIDTSVCILGSDGTTAMPIFNSYGSASAFNGSDFLNGPAYPGLVGDPHTYMTSGNSSSRSVTVDGITPIGDASAILNSPNGLSLGVRNGGEQSPAYGYFNELAIWNNIVASSADMQRLT